MSNCCSTVHLVDRKLFPELNALSVADIRRIAPASSSTIPNGGLSRCSSTFCPPFQRWLFAFLAVALFVPMLLAQSPAASGVARDQQAVQVISTAITVLGGSAAFASIQDVVTTGACQNTQAPTSTPPKSHFTWTIAGDEYRYETIIGGTSDVLASGHGRPANSTATGKKQLAVFQSRIPYHLPGLVLYRELQDQRYTFRYMGQKQLARGMTTWVETAVIGVQKPSPLTVQDWYFGPDGLPVQVDYRLAAEGNIRHSLTISVAFSNYQSAMGTTQPGILATMYPGGKGGICTISRSTANTQPAPSIFDLQ